MNKLQKLLTDLDNEKHFVNMDLSAVDWRTRPSMEMRQNQAKQNAKEIAFEFQKEFINTLAKVFVVGKPEKIDQFRKLLKKEGALSFSANSMYESIAEVVMPMLNGEAFGAAAFIRLVEVVHAMSSVTGVYPDMPLQEPKGAVVHSMEDMVQLVKTVIRQAFGDRLNCNYILNNIANEALAMRYDKNMAVLVLSNLSNEEKAVMLESLFPGQPNFSLEIGDDEEVNKSLVLKIYSKISSTFHKLGKLPKTETKSEEKTETENQGN